MTIGYNWPVAAQKPEIASTCAWASGIALPLWINHQAQTFDDSGAFVPLSLPPGTGDSPASYSVSRTGDGFMGCVADGDGGLWLMANKDYLWYLPYPDTISGFRVDLTGGGGLSDPGGTFTTVDENSGLLYFTAEISSGTSPIMAVGLATSSGTVDNLLDLTAGGTQNGVVYFSDGSIRSNGALIGTADTWTNGDTVQCAFAAPLGQVWFRVNSGEWNGDPSADPAAFMGGFIITALLDYSNAGTWIRKGTGTLWNGDGSADPSTGIGGFSISAIAPGTLWYVTGTADASTITYNFGASAFVGAVPTGVFPGWPHVGGGYTTFDPATVSGGVTLSGGNLVLTSGSSLGGAQTLDGWKAGTFYDEFTLTHSSFFTNNSGGGPSVANVNLPAFISSGSKGGTDPLGGAAVTDDQFHNIDEWIAGTKVLDNVFTFFEGDTIGRVTKLSDTIPVFAFVGGYTAQTVTAATMNFGAASFSPAAPSGYSGFNAAATLDPAKLTGAAELSDGNLVLNMDLISAPVTTTVNTGITATGVVASGVAASGVAAMVVDAKGVLFLTSSQHPGIVETITPAFGELARGLSANEVDLYTVLPLSSSLGVMSLAGRSFSSLMTPMQYPAFVSVAATGTAIAVSGWSLASIASGAAQFAASPIGLLTTRAAFTSPGESSVVMIEGSDPVWAVTSVATGQSGCSFLAWGADGIQVLTSCTSSVNVLQISGGELVQAQTLSVASPGRIAMTPDGSNALVCQTSSDQIGVMVNTLDTWTVGTPTVLTSPTAVVLTSNTEGYAAANSNLYTLSRAGNVWSATLLTALGFPVNNMALDPQGRLYIVGSDVNHGYLTLVVDNAITGTLTWTGSGDDLVVSQTQIAVMDLTGAAVFILGTPGHDTLGENTLGFASGAEMRMDGVLGTGTLFDANAQVTAGAPIFPLNVSAFGFSANSVWLCGSDDLYICSWERPYQIRNRRAGEFALWDGSHWGQYHMGVQHDPSAMVWDASGNVEVATQENDIFTFGGYVVASGSATGVPLLASEVIPVYVGQLAGTPLGIAALTWRNGSLYAGTGFSGVLLKVM